MLVLLITSVSIFTSLYYVCDCCLNVIHAFQRAVSMERNHNLDVCMICMQYPLYLSIIWFQAWHVSVHNKYSMFHGLVDNVGNCRMFDIVCIRAQKV